MLLLVRTLQPPDGTFGTLTGAGLSLVTVERPWLANAADVSCIPAGTYQLHRSMFYKHGYEAFEVTGVPGRSRILMHIANTEDDVEGCIGLGLRFGKLLVGGVPRDAVVESREAFARFMAALAGIDTATLTVTWAPGLPVAA